MAKSIQTQKQELQLEGLRIVQRQALKYKREQQKKRELAERNRKARAYIRSCKRKRRQELRDKVFAIGIGAVCAGLIFTMVACSNTEPRYAIAGEQGNGIHYIYVTERKCEVTEVTDTQVYVSYKGNEYSFYAHDTELEVGNKVICKFTDNWKIVDFK